MRILKKIIGWLLIIGGLPLTIVGIAELFHPGPSTASGIGRGLTIGVTTFFGAMVAAGLALLRSAFLRSRERRAARREEAALRLAGELGGTLGPSELAARGAMSFAEAQAELDRLAKLGACELVLTDKGAIFYRFPDLMAPRRVRDSARGLLEE